MGFGIKLRIFGDWACFTRPEMKVERVSYDIITPSAARGIIEAIYWKPAIVWVIDKIHIINPIQFTNIRRNEVGQKISAANIKSAMNGKNDELYLSASDDRQQRAAMVLKDVCYIIEAHFEMTGKAGQADTPEKHYNIALRRMREGQCYHQPCLGTREFGANVELIEGEIPPSFYEGQELDLGFMLYDIDFENDMTPIFFRAIMKNGVLDLGSVARRR